MSSDEESTEPPARITYEYLLEILQENVVHSSAGETGNLFDLSDELRVANCTDWTGEMSGDTVCMVINDVAIPCEYIREHPELINYQVGFCQWCRHAPCYLDHEEAGDVWQTAIDILAERDFETLNSKERSAIRYPLYKGFFTIIHGIGRRGNRVKLPECVTNRIRATYPDAQDDYVGFRGAPPVADAAAG
jgi:hypothetical protein